MRLHRLKVEQLRRFRQPFELSGLDAGLNLFAGPNEAGKSTLVRAIRAAFFERYRSTSVDDLLPWGEQAATPTVELDFDAGGRAFRLRKTFLNKKRCELSAGAAQLDGDEAEAHLAELLGFEYASRGASKADYWGIPGLLWIEQGAGHEIGDAVGHASGHLRRALDQSVGEVASSQGDDVLARVRELRNALLTQAGKPRAAYAEALAEQQQRQARLEELDQAIAQYRQQVDQLGALAAQDAADEAQRPWDTMRAQQQAAQARLDAIELLRGQLGADRAELARVREQLKLVEAQLAGFDQQQRELAVRESALQEAETALESQRAGNAVHGGASAAAEAAYRAAGAALDLARQEDLRADMQRRAFDADARAAAVSATLALAQAEQQRLLALRQATRATAPTAKDLARLRTLQGAIAELKIRQDMAATRLRFDLAPDAPVTLAGQALRGAGERALTGESALEVAGIGVFHIAPGGTDLAELARATHERQAEWEALLQRVGAASLEEAEQREAQHRDATRELAQVEKTCAQLMPHGPEALQAQLADQSAAAAEARARLAQLPPAPAQAPVPLAQARAQQEAAHEHLSQVARQAAQAQVQLATAQAQRDGALRERDALQALLGAPERRERQAAAARSLLHARAEADALETRVQQRHAEVEAARPDVLAQDVERWRRSADQAHQQYLERRTALAVLRVKLEEAGAQGLEEARAEAALRAAAAQRRVDELHLRADALELLLGLLESRRQALTRRLRAPLQKRVDHYLQLLFPQASLDLGDDLAPAQLTRQGAHGPEAGHFDEMSFGAREQMGVISRLAYADLLKQAGRPTLIILDDALVHSDAGRLEQMKRVLFDAAQRHQVLLFTCHPQAWQGLGASARTIGA